MSAASPPPVQPPAPRSPSTDPAARRPVRLGVHTPLQHTAADALLDLWRRTDTIDAFDWISVWDHLGALDGQPANLEAVAAHAALAVTTSRVQVACLVYSVGYRPPLVLADALATIDHLSAGRAVLGLGAGYLVGEYAAQGRTLPPARDRLDHLAETITAMRALFAGETVTVHGAHVHLDGARCAPAPLRPALPIVVGGGGERRTIPLAARLADGWNVPLSAPDDAARKVALLREHTVAAGRDADAVEASLSVGLCFDESRLAERYGARVEALRPAIATGSTQQVVDTMARFVLTGADRIVLSMRAPYDQAVLEDLLRFVDEVVPALPSARAAEAA